MKIPVDKYQIVKHSLTRFAIYERNPKYPMNPPGQDFLLIADGEWIWGTAALTRLCSAGPLFIDESDKGAWDEYVKAANQLKKDISPRVVFKQIEDVGVHLLKASHDTKFDDTTIEHFQGIAEAVVDLLRNTDEAVHCIRTLVEHSAYTYFHSVGVGILTPAIAMEMGEKREEVLNEYALGGLLHDLGKLYISNDILNKPAKLDPDEWEEIRKHPLMGLERLSKVTTISDVVKNIISMHHEKLTGRGYPYGHSADEIPMEARIAAIADIYNALTTTRSYCPKRNAYEALMLMKHQMKEEICPEAMAALVKILSKDPQAGLNQST